MVRPHLKSAALLFLILCASLAQAQDRSARPPSRDAVRVPVIAAHMADTLVAAAHPQVTIAAVLTYTLPPEPKPTTHWPWWLRILAVIFLLVFIRIVAGSVRSKPSGPSPN